MEKWLKSSTPAKSTNVPEPTPLPSPLAVNEALSSTRDEDVSRFECDLSLVRNEKSCVIAEKSCVIASVSSQQEVCFLSISSSMADAIDCAFNIAEDNVSNVLSGSDPDLVNEVAKAATELCENGDVSTAHSLEDALDIEIVGNEEIH